MLMNGKSFLIPIFKEAEGVVLEVIGHTMHTIGYIDVHVVYKGCDVSKKDMCLILSVFISNLYLQALR